SEPVNDGPASDQAEHEGRMKKRQLVHISGKPVGERHDNGEDHGRGADYGSANQYRFRGCLEGVSGAVVGFQQVLGAIKFHIDIEVLLDLLKFDRAKDLLEANDG